MHDIHIPTCYVINEIHKAHMQEGHVYAQPQTPPSPESDSLGDFRDSFVIYVINRICDTERLQWFMDNADQAHMDVIRHDATDWRSMNLHWMTQNGYLHPDVHWQLIQKNKAAVHMRHCAIWNSHVCLWRRLQMMDIKEPVMIFEDDSLITPDFARILQPYIDNLVEVDFDMAYFSLRQSFQRYR